MTTNYSELNTFLVIILFTVVGLGFYGIDRYVAYRDADPYNQCFKREKENYEFACFARYNKEFCDLLYKKRKGAELVARCEAEVAVLSAGIE